MEQERVVNVLIIWRGKQLSVGVNPDAKVGDLGKKLQELTNVKQDTMKLFVPQSSKKSSIMISPFSDEHSCLSVREMSLLEGKPIKMMGVFDVEIEEVSHSNMKPDLRIAGFEEEERRLRQRVLDRPHAPLKLPTGTYIFCDFRTLHIPGIELNPPASEALRRMHMLACDPGIVAIMNKHHWRVGVMTEMAPIGYVGISPKCVLGYNKNYGEEISLRLRTDDLKGFRKYENIKKTLLHELAHMVYSEHDANFFALNKQLNQEAASLDWTKSGSRTLSGRRMTDHYEEEIYLGASSNHSGQKLGGASDALATARASSVAAAYYRLLNREKTSETSVEPDFTGSQVRDNQEQMHAERDPDDTLVIEEDDMDIDVFVGPSSVHKVDVEPDPDDHLDDERMFEPDPDDSHAGEAIVSISEPDPDDSHAGEAIVSISEPDPDDSHAGEAIVSISEPDPDESEVGKARKSAVEPDPDDSISSKFDLNSQETMEPTFDHSKKAEKDQHIGEPDPDDSGTARISQDGVETKHRPASNNSEEPDPDDRAGQLVMEAGNKVELDSNGPLVVDVVQAEPDPDDHIDGLDNQEIQRIEAPVTAVCARLQRAIKTLRTEITPAEATSVLQILFKIIRNVIEHPDEMKFRRLRKANPQFQRNVANYEAAMEILTMIGFSEDIQSDEIGRAESYMVLKRNDPGLLWLAKSSLEVSMA